MLQRVNIILVGETTLAKRLGAKHTGHERLGVRNVQVAKRPVTVRITSSNKSHNLRFRHLTFKG